MKISGRLGKFGIVSASLITASFFAAQFGVGGLWRGFEPALAVTAASPTAKPPYDLTRLDAVNETLNSFATNTSNLDG
jgi:carboxyl-terminal processing protease